MSTPDLKFLRAISIKAGFAPSDPIGLAGASIRLIQNKTADGTVVEVIATTDDVDLADEVVVPTGASMDYFRRNGSVFIDHETTMDSRVGVARSIRPWPTAATQRGWMVDIAMDKGERAQECLEKCRSGGMGVSIGFRASDYGAPTPEEVKAYTRDGRPPKSIVRAWDWLELSFTPMPCNVACRVVSVPESAKMVRRIAWKDGKAYTRIVPA